MVHRGSSLKHLSSFPLPLFFFPLFVPRPIIHWENQMHYMHTEICKALFPLPYIIPSNPHFVIPFLVVIELHESPYKSLRLTALSSRLFKETASSQSLLSHGCRYFNFPISLFYSVVKWG